jgi:transposase
MARTLSEDLRSRLITAVEGGLSRRAAADRFGVAAATAVRWVRDWHATGATRAKAKAVTFGRGGSRSTETPF